MRAIGRNAGITTHRDVRTHYRSCSSRQI